MKESLTRSCELYIRNRDILREAESWGDSNAFPLCANLFTVKNVLADGKKYKECKDLLKQRLMYAGMIAMNEHIGHEDAKGRNISYMNGIVSIILAEQAAMCAAMAAMAAGTTTAIN